MKTSALESTAQAWIRSALSDQWVSPSALEDVLAKNGPLPARSTLTRRLQAMVTSGQVETRGRGRGVQYRLNPVGVWFSASAEHRPRVNYDPDRFRSYQPNVTRWLTPEQHQRLRGSQPIEHDASSYAKSVAEKLMVDLSYASSSLEGNTYNYLDTEALINYGASAEGKEADETQMILNHKRAVEYLVDVCSDDSVIPRTLKEFHVLLGQNLIDDRELGVFRRRPVVIGGSSYRPLDVPSKIEEEFNVLVDTANSIKDPFEQSLFWMVSVSYLQAFVDINKRTGRLACNLPLLKAGLAPLSFMSMEKPAYIRGLLEFYELGTIGTIAQAFTNAYVSSAHRYETYMKKTPQDVFLDRSYKSELSSMVGAWVKRPTHDVGEWIDVATALLPASLDAGMRQQIITRAQALVDGMNEANRLLYGISIADYKAFESRRSLVESSDPAAPALSAKSRGPR